MRRQERLIHVTFLKVAEWAGAREQDLTRQYPLTLAEQSLLSLKWVPNCYPAEGGDLGIRRFMI